MTTPTQYDAVLGGNNPSPSIHSASAVMGTSNKYKNPDHKQFCLDMAAIQLPVEHYIGRFFYSGPAVRVSDDIQDVLSYTKVKCVWDAMGKNGWIVYPRSYDQESVLKVKKLIDANQFPVYSRVEYASCESYKRQFDALLEMIELELNLTPVKQ